MSTIELKYQIFELISSINDSKSLKNISKYVSGLVKSKSVDWWDELSETQKAEIEESIAQADKGELILNSEVMKKYKKWLA